jgi:hypothetical protein
MSGLFYGIAVLFLILWAMGFLFAHVGAHIGGGLIHILLVLAVAAVVYNLITGRRVV